MSVTHASAPGRFFRFFHDGREPAQLLIVDGECLFISGADYGFAVSGFHGYASWNTLNDQEYLTATFRMFDQELMSTVVFRLEALYCSRQ